ncbi:hypothetical protein VCH24_58260 [Variovorax boronicumulans]|nr:hypothetical protein VCH24_58260 [Variovorax boronicumulans]
MLKSILASYGSKALVATHSLVAVREIPRDCVHVFEQTDEGLVIKSLSPDGERWVACKPGFFLSVRVLSRLFRRRFLEALGQLHRAGRLRFFGEFAALTDVHVFAHWLAPLHKCEWVVYAKRPFAGPEAVLAYLSRYTHRVAISNSRLVAMDEQGVTFRWKDYRAKGHTRRKTMTLDADEFMRRFLLHVLPGGFHRIRHYGLLANGNRAASLARIRELLGQETGAVAQIAGLDAQPCLVQPTFVCTRCGGSMLVLSTLARGQPIRASPQRPRAP